MLQDPFKKTTITLPTISIEPVEIKVEEIKVEETKKEETNPLNYKEEILNQYGGLPSNIPVGHNYWKR